MPPLERLLVTGGCGFIGSHFVRLALRRPRTRLVVNLDALTYAGNPENLRDVEGDPRYRFAKGSVCDAERVDALVREGVDAIVHFAAESHVDRSLYGPVDFVRTNLEGTSVLLEAARRAGLRRFLQVSTDEVYGSLPREGRFRETTPLHPNNPYSTTKAAADLMVGAYVRTFGIDAVVTRSSNNYGPHQHPEKFIPLFISNALQDKPCPLYGDGMHVRDWLHVEDNARGIWAALAKGKGGRVYNLGGGNERPNLEVARAILRLLRKPESLVAFVQDRPGHDRRYAIDCSRARRDLGWTPRVSFERGLRDTVAWYRANPGWVERVRSGAYREYYARQYGDALRAAAGMPAASRETTPVRRRRT